MTVGWFVTILGFVVGGGFLIVREWDRHDFAKSLVLGALGRCHPSNVKVQRDWLDFDEDTLTFDVEYTTVDGRRHRNTCKVATHALADQKLYWAEPLQSAREIEASSRMH